MLRLLFLVSRMIFTKIRIDAVAHCTVRLLLTMRLKDEVKDEAISNQGARKSKWFDVRS